MPIYEFECLGCGREVEFKLSIADRDFPQACPKCQAPMRRLIGLPHPPIMPETGRGKVLASLNAKDDGIGNKPHIKNALWKGLNQRDPVVGRGFG